MKILVTGGSGFIGSNLVRFLLNQTEHSVVNFDKLTYAGNAESLSDVERNSRYEFCHADICDRDALRKVFKNCRPGSVMHLAAESHVDRSIDGPEAFIETNIKGTYQLLQAARDHFESLEGAARNQFRFLHISTDEVYGSLSNDEPEFSESTAYDPHSPYSASKAASDHLVRAWHDTYGLPVLITNCSNNYGPYQFPEKLIPVVILKAIRGDSIPVYGKGENIRDWLYVEDHVQALYTVATRGKAGETYNIGGNNERRNIDLVKSLCEVLDELLPSATNPALLENGVRISSYKELITFVKDRPGHDMRYAIDATKIANELGWQPHEDPKSGFVKTVKWYLDNRSWWQRILSGEYRLERIGLDA